MPDGQSGAVLRAGDTPGMSNSLPPRIPVPAEKLFPRYRIHSLIRYLGFLHTAILPLTSKAGDMIYGQYSDDIEYAAQCLREGLGYTPVLLYRGILVDRHDIDSQGCLVPIPHIRYLSFSERREVAEYFADPDSPMSGLLIRHRPLARGYLIQYTPAADEVLFSWRWVEALNLNAIGNHLSRVQPTSGEWDPMLVSSQREVIIRQTGRHFSLEPF
jgi:hypothetical protein